jgi:drug/metabolite transporter (DMT)-like permease
MVTSVQERTRPRSRLQNPTLRTYLALALGIVCIGFSAIFTKWATLDQTIPGTVSGFYRVAIATAVLALPFLVQARRQGITGYRGSKVTWWALWLAALAGLFFALDLAFWNTSLLYTNAANATLLGNTSTLWVSIGAVLIFHESLKRRFWLGMLLALVGTAVIMGRDMVEHPSLGLGDLLAIAGGLFYAGYLLGTQRARRFWATLPFMWVSSLVASLALLAYVLFMGEPLSGFTERSWLALLALALISHVLGWLSINYALGHLPASITSVTLLAQPVFTALVAVPLLGEPLSLYQIGGGLLVLLGIYIVNRR